MPQKVGWKSGLYCVIEEVKWQRHSTKCTEWKNEDRESYLLMRSLLSFYFIFSIKVENVKSTLQKK